MSVSKKEVSNSPELTDLEKLNKGESVCFYGKLVNQTKASITLFLIGGNCQLVVKDEDVISIEEEKDHVFVEIAKYADVLIKQEFVSKVEISKTKCERNKDDKEMVALDIDITPYRPSPTFPSPPIMTDCYIWEVQFITIGYRTDKNGYVKAIRIPVPVRRRCDGW